MNQSMKTPVQSPSLRHLCRPGLMMSQLRFRAQSVGSGWCAETGETWWNHQINKAQSWNLLSKTRLQQQLSTAPPPPPPPELFILRLPPEETPGAPVMFFPWIIEAMNYSASDAVCDSIVIPSESLCTCCSMSWWRQGLGFRLRGRTAWDNENPIRDSGERSCGWFGFELSDKCWTVVSTEKVHLLSPGPGVWEEEEQWVSFWDWVQTCA